MKDCNWIKCCICGDSKDILKHIPDNAIDLILTDPPYNLAKHSTGNIPLPGRSSINNDLAEWDLIDFIPEEWADEFCRILKPTGNLFIFTSYYKIGNWHSCLDHRFDTSNFMVWHKTNPAPKIFKAGFLNSCELIFACWNKGHTWNFTTQKEMHNFLESPICMRPERLSEPKHPAQKPVSILKKIVHIASNPGDIVLDPFMGVGSTGIAALNLKRRFIGIEINQTYCVAAKQRIEQYLKNNPTTMYSNNKSDQQSIAEEPMVCYNPSPTLTDIFTEHYPDITIAQPITRETNLSPIIKWPGGKEKELVHIIPNLPSFHRFIEPFVGGGSVFMGINAAEYLINDLSTELVSLYNYIKERNTTFFDIAYAIDSTWSNIDIFFAGHSELIDKYIDFRNNRTEKKEIEAYVKVFIEKNKHDLLLILDDSLPCRENIFIRELLSNLTRKLYRMRQLEEEKHQLPLSDVSDNILTAIKSAVYMYFRALYNDVCLLKEKPILHNVLFFFLRNYAYSGMFRYSKNGDFNVPYGGIAYNSKKLSKKLSYYLSNTVAEHFKNACVFNADFEEFLEKVSPDQNDFIFLDPPYDTEFSTYAQNSFTQHDQSRLANYLLNKCKAKWMLIIKNTDFIYNLYNQTGITIKSFDKKYMVSFMNRNDRNVTHLLITNYKI